MIESGITPREREAIIERMPFVDRIAWGSVCEGQLAHRRDTRPCHYVAKWLYAPVTGGKVRYCTVHIFARGLLGWPEDAQRTYKWIDANFVRVLAEIREGKS